MFHSCYFQNCVMDKLKINTKKDSSRNFKRTFIPGVWACLCFSLIWDLCKLQSAFRLFGTSAIAQSLISNVCHNQCAHLLCFCCILKLFPLRNGNLNRKAAVFGKDQEATCYKLFGYEIPRPVTMFCWHLRKCTEAESTERKWLAFYLVGLVQ